MTSNKIMTFENIYMKYNKQQVFQDLNLNIEKGITLIAGRNGAGKSTLMKMMVNLEKPLSGNIFFFNRKRKNTLKKKEKKELGFQFQNDSFLKAVKVKEYIKLYHYFYDSSKNNYDPKKIFDMLKINELENKYAYNLSGGEKKRLSLYLSIIGSKKVIILDEPTAGIDIELKVIILEVLQYLKKYGVNIIVSSHDIEEFISICDTLIILNKQVLFNGTKEQFYKLYKYKYKSKISNNTEYDFKRNEENKVVNLFEENYIVSENREDLSNLKLKNIEKMTFRDYYFLIISENEDINNGI